MRFAAGYSNRSREPVCTVERGELDTGFLNCRRFYMAVWGQRTTLPAKFVANSKLMATTAISQHRHNPLLILYGHVPFSRGYGRTDAALMLALRTRWPSQRYTRMLAAPAVRATDGLDAERFAERLSNKITVIINSAESQIMYNSILPKCPSPRPALRLRSQFSR